MEWVHVAEGKNNHHDDRKLTKIAPKDGLKLSDDQAVTQTIAERLIWIADDFEMQRHRTVRHRGTANYRPICSTANEIHRNTCDNQRLLTSAASSSFLLPLATCTVMLVASWLVGWWDSGWWMISQEYTSQFLLSRSISSPSHHEPQILQPIQIPHGTSTLKQLPSEVCKFSVLPPIPPPIYRHPRRERETDRHTDRDAGAETADVERNGKAQMHGWPKTQTFLANSMTDFQRLKSTKLRYLQTFCFEVNANLSLFRWKV